MTGAVGSVTGNVGGNVVGSIGSLATQAKTDVEDAAWDATLADHLDSGSTGAALNAAGAAGDPWSTTLPGAYGAGTAGYIVGTNLNATITSRMATYTQPTGFLAATFPATVASTTNITAASGVALTSAYDAAKTAAQAGDVMKVSSGTGANQISLSSGAVLLQPTQTGVTIPNVTNLANAPTSGDFTAAMKTSIGTAVAASAVASVTGNVGGNVAGSVGSVTGNVGGNVVGSVGSVSAGVTLAANAVDGTAVASSGASEIATAVGALSLGASNNNYTMTQGLTILLSGLAGKVSGEDTGAPVFRDLADTKNVITGTDDGDGNRLTISYNP